MKSVTEGAIQTKVHRSPTPSVIHYTYTPLLEILLSFVGPMPNSRPCW